MTDSDVVLSAAIKGWLAGCVAGTLVLFVHGFVVTVLAPDGMRL